MNNNTLTRVKDSITGEILDEYYDAKISKSWYHGPRKYWRLMELYDKAQLLLSSKPGILLLIHLKTQINTKTYRIDINKTWLAEDLGVNRKSIIENVKRLVSAGYLIQEPRNQYFLHPGMFWYDDLSADEWQELKKDYLSKLEVEAPVAS